MEVKPAPKLAKTTVYMCVCVRALDTFLACARSSFFSGFFKIARSDQLFMGEVAPAASAVAPNCALDLSGKCRVKFVLGAWFLNFRFFLFSSVRLFEFYGYLGTNMFVLLRAVF